ncbi:hypothetical protein HJFPF1_12968 [Paramyrothecium foliicola]|nr:hypothetical protein HJFPF1_12968 [Paramyrothecium foliicola]
MSRITQPAGSNASPWSVVSSSVGLESTEILDSLADLDCGITTVTFAETLADNHEEQINAHGGTMTGPPSENAFIPAHQLQDNYVSPILSPASLSGLLAQDYLPCGLLVDSDDQKAIRLYKTSFASSVDTKHPEYSVPAVVLQTAASDPAVMHMILAIGHQLVSEMHGERSEYARACASLRSSSHYNNAIQRLAKYPPEQGSSVELDTFLAARWLMVSYEQRFSERPLQSIMAQLRSVASCISQVNLRHLVETLQDEDDSLTAQQDTSCGNSQPSLLSARLLIWLIGFDARAATYGMGGLLNSAIAQSLAIGQNPCSRQSWARILSTLHENSGPLFQVTWGKGYPDDEILYDIEHKNIFGLFRESAQLRLMVAEMRLTVSDAKARQAQASSIEKRIRMLERQNMDLFTITSKLPESARQLSNGLLTTICWVMPHYYAGVLEYLLSINPCDSTVERRAEMTQNILKLALYGYRKDGQATIVRVAWPMFIAGLETTDQFQQQWIVDRLEACGLFGRSYRSAAGLMRCYYEQKFTDAIQDEELAKQDLRREVSLGNFFI